MKNLKFILPFCVFIAFSYTISAQVPDGFNYMSIARDGNGDILKGEDIGVRIAILDGDLTTAWEEEHSVTTNNDGLFQLVVGDPTATPTGTGYEDYFSDIDWTMQPLYIKTTVSLEAGVWLEMGTAQLFSVPYAMVSNYSYELSDNPFTMNVDTIVMMHSVDVVGNYPKETEEALFEVKRQDGQTMFAVYNQGVRINVPLDDNIKGVKGGFSIGGFGSTKDGEIIHELFTLNKDSARIYIDQTPDLLPKGAKGGFSIGGFSYAGKQDEIQDYLFIAPDSARIYVDDSGKGVKGGFAIGGYGGTKGPATNFMDITPKNYFIGHESGSKLPDIDPGIYNSVMGYQAGKNLTTGGYNTIIGYNAGINATSGNNNILLGNYAGNNLTTGIHNTLIGNSAGYSHTDQSYNVLVGTSAGSHINSSGWEGSFNTYIGINSGHQMRYSKENVFLGTNAGYWLDNGLGNTFVGIDAGRSRSETGEPHEWRSGVRADYNTIIGDKAGYLVTNSYNNVIVGYQAGYNIGDGDGNVFIGNQAGYNESGNNKLYIDNSPSDPPLMYGDFSVNQLGINTKTLGNTLNVGGDAYVSGNLSAGSITAPVTGNVTGNLIGNVNGVETGKIYLHDSGEIQTSAGGKFRLSWDRGDGIIILENNHETLPCHYWFKKINKEDPNEGSGVMDPLSGDVIISGTNVDGTGIEVHFGYADGITGYCSVWLQYFDGALIGHYLKD